MRSFRGPTAAILAALVLATASPADEALRTDGKRVSGTLTFDDTGRPRFTPKGQTEPLPPETVRSVRLDAPPPTPFRVAVGHVVVLRTGERLTGQLLGLDSDVLRLRMPWAERVEVPRGAVAAVTQVPGLRVLLDDDFRDGAKAWRVIGNPAVSGEAVLSRPGQELTLPLAKPLAAGRVGVNFEAREAATGARWLFEAEFASEKDRRLLHVHVAGMGDAYHVETEGLRGSARDVARTPGPHRLTLRFGPRSLAVLCDDSVLWHDLEHGPGGRLLQVRLSCVEGEKGATTKGAVAWTEFAVAAAVDEPPRPSGDSAQDEVWLADGDQLFGQLVRADRRTVVLKGRSGERSLPWSGVRGCFLRAADAPRPADGERVRLLLHAPFGGEPDVLLGVVRRFDDRTLTLTHALFGSVVLERGRVKEVRR
jgi:hypothetical protein